MTLLCLDISARIYLAVFAFGIWLSMAISLVSRVFDFSSGVLVGHVCNLISSGAIIIGLLSSYW